MKHTLFLIILIAIASNVFSQKQNNNLTFQYVKGEVTLLPTKTKIKIGQVITEGNSFSLGKDAQVEILFNQYKFKISEAGIYNASFLVESIKLQNAYGVSSNLKRLASGQIDLKKNPQLNLTSAGVRNTNIGTKNLPKESENLKKSVMVLFKGNTKDALAGIQNSFESYEGEDPAFYYYYALALIQEGQPRLALSILENANLEIESQIYIEGGPSPDEYADYIILLQGYIYSADPDYSKLVDWADDAQEYDILPITKQEVLMIQAMAYSKLNKTDLWKSNLEEIISIDSKSDFANDAKKLLEAK